jgi:hypothetical protein
VPSTAAGGDPGCHRPAPRFRTAVCPRVPPDDGGLAAGYGTPVLYHAGVDTVVVVMVNETAEDLPGQVEASIMRVLASGE